MSVRLRQSRLYNKDWTEFDNCDDVDTKWNILYTYVVNTLDDPIPIKTLIFPKSKPEWLVGELVEYMKDRDALLRVARRTKLLADKKASNKARNKVNKSVKNAKNNFIKEKLDNYQNKPKKDGNQLSNAQTASEITQNTLKNLVETRYPAQAQFLAPECPIFELKHPTLQELNVNIKEILFKFSGTPMIATRIWKLLFLARPDLLLSIVRTSIDMSTFPTEWKRATVIPIPKVSKPMGPEDLRPISLLPLPGKICEHLIHAQINSFLERNNLLTKFQNGFRTKRSTVQTIFDYLSDFINTYNNKEETIAIYINFKTLSTLSTKAYLQSNYLRLTLMLTHASY